MIYNIGDKLKVKKEINALCMDMENPDVIIPKGEIFTVTDKDDYPENNHCHWYELTSENGSLSAWNDSPDHMIIDDCFEIMVDC